MKTTNNVLLPISIVLFICHICPERQWGPGELFTLRLGTHSSRVHMCSCCRHISGLADSEDVVNTLLRVRTCTKEETPQQLIRTSAHFALTFLQDPSLLGESHRRHAVYAGGRSEAAQESPGGKSLTGPLVRRGDIGDGWEDAVRRGSALASSPPPKPHLNHLTHNCALLFLNYPSSLCNVYCFFHSICNSSMPLLVSDPFAAAIQFKLKALWN